MTGRYTRRQTLLTLMSLVAITMGCFEQQNPQTRSAAAEPMQTPIYSYQIVQTYPHDPAAFTQGLIYADGNLYEGTGLYGASSLRRVDLETGEVIQIANLAAQYFGEGITLWDDRLIQLTWRSQMGFVYDRQTFAKLAEFKYPTEGWGLTHNGELLIMSDGTDTLYFLDPHTFEEVKRVRVQDQGTPIDRLNELEYVNGEVFANVWFSDRIARIAPDTGDVVGWLDLTGLLEPDAINGDNPDAVLNGIAYDAAGDRLFVTGKLWPKLFEIELIKK